MTGLNADDIGVNSNAALNASEFQEQAGKRFGDLASAFLQLYAVKADAQVAAAMSESSRDQSRVSMYLWAVNRAKTAKTKAYTYYWNYTLPGPDAATYKAFHTSEVPYALNTRYMSDRPFTGADYKIAGVMSSYWVNFATTRDPNGKGLPPWPAVSERPGTTMQIGDGTNTVLIADSPAKIDFWKQFFAQTRATHVNK